MLEDNYGYILTLEGASDDALVIDPTLAAPVLAKCRELGKRVSCILATHHHDDHTGGITGILEHFPKALVYGSAYDGEQKRIPKITDALNHGATRLWHKQRISVIQVPGHTLGAIAYLIGDALFTGDTLFVGGCGRLFEGTAAQMHASLRRLAALPPETKVYCGHEYGKKNLEFCAKQGNQAAAERLKNLPAITVPSMLGDELQHNVFMGCDVEEFTRLREARNHW